MNKDRSVWLRRAVSLVAIIVLLVPMVFGSSKPVIAASTLVVDPSYTEETPGWGVTAFATIQSAVDVAIDGDTVQVNAGTYIEQVHVGKTITLAGADKTTTIIQAPVAMTEDCTSPILTNSPVVCVNGQASPTIQGFTIDGAKSASSHMRLMGLAVRNAGGTFQDNIIKNVCFETDGDAPCDPSTVQEGVGIYVYNSEISTLETVNILNNTIFEFNKNGITVTAQTNWDAVNFLIQGNTITGFGSNQTVVQNGIQVELPGGSGTITENTISNILFNNTSDLQNRVANSILLMDTSMFPGLSVTTSSNTISNAQGGIYYFDTQGVISSNVIGVVKPGKNAYGILASDPPWAVPSPYDSSYMTDEEQVGEGPAVDAALMFVDTLVVETFGNLVSFSGANNTATVGIASEGGLGIFNLDVDFHDNTISGFENGLGLYYCTLSPCTAGVYTNLTAVGNNLLSNTNGLRLTGQYENLDLYPFAPQIHHNRFFGNANGLYNDAFEYATQMLLPVPAENNWWGCNEGPGAAGCDADAVTNFGSVDYAPWLVLSTSASPVTIPQGTTSILTASLKLNSDALDTTVFGLVPDGIPVTFSAATLGTVDPLTGSITSGTAQTTFTAPASEGGYQACATVDNQEVCSEIAVLPALISAFDLLQSADQTTWAPVTGSFAGGYTVFLDPLVQYFYFDADNFTTSRTLADGLHPFNVDTYPSGFFAYWDGRGVNASAAPESWQGLMWQIINGELPMFFLEVNGVDTMLVDGLQYALSSGVVKAPLRIDGAYLPGAYTFTGEVDDTEGYANPITVSVDFIHYPQISSDDLAGPFTTGVSQEFHVTLDNADGVSYTNVLAHFRIANAVPADVASLEYWETLDSSWHTLPLTVDGTDLVGDYGPALGFPMPAGHNATSLFRVTFNTAGNYDVTITLDDLTPDPDVTLASMLETAVVESPTFDIFLPVIFK